MESRTAKQRSEEGQGKWGKRWQRMTQWINTLASVFLPEPIQDKDGTIMRHELILPFSHYNLNLLEYGSGEDLHLVTRAERLSVEGTSSEKDVVQ